MEKISNTILFATLLAAATGCESREEKEYRESRVEETLTLVERLIGELSTRCSETLKPPHDEGKTVFSDRHQDIPAVSTYVVEGGVANTRPLEGDDGLASGSNSEENICTCNKGTCSHANNLAVFIETTDRVSITIDEDEEKSEVAASAFHNDDVQECEHKVPELNDDGTPVLEFSGETGTLEPVMRTVGDNCTDFAAITLDKKKRKCTVEVEGGEKFKAPDFARCAKFYEEAQRVRGEIQTAIRKRTADLKRRNVPSLHHRPQQR